MGRFIDAADRGQASFLPACLEDYVDLDNPVRIIDAFVDELDLSELGFARVQPASTGRSGYAPGTMLKLYVHGDLSPKSPPVLRRVLGLMFGPKRPVFPVPDCWRIRWA